MAWTTPKTWSVDELVTAGMLNAQLRDNLNALKLPPAAEYTGELVDSTTVGSFADVDATNLSLTITTTGGAVLIGYMGIAYWTGSASSIGLDVTVDGTRVGNAARGLVQDNANAGSSLPANASFVVRKAGLAAGSHTFRLQFCRATGTGTCNLISEQFWVAEVS